MNIIMSIKPRYANSIIDGTKKFEFRRSAPKRIGEVEKVFIYSTSPTKKIIGHITVKKVHKMKLLDLWLHTWQYSGVSIAEFEEYFQGKEFGYAIEIDEVFAYEIPLLFNEIDPSGKIPQSFKYIQQG